MFYDFSFPLSDLWLAIRMMNRNKLSYNYAIILLGCLMAIAAQIGISLYLASFPAIMQYFQASKSSIALSLTLYLIGYAFSLLGWGILADSIGHKRTLILALILFA